MLRERQRTGEESVREETVFLTWGQEVRTAEGSWWWWGGAGVLMCQARQRASWGGLQVTRWVPCNSSRVPPPLSTISPYGVLPKKKIYNLVLVAIIRKKDLFAYLGWIKWRSKGFRGQAEWWQLQGPV